MPEWSHQNRALAQCLNELIMQFDMPVDHDRFTKPIFERYLSNLFGIPLSEVWDKAHEWRRSLRSVA